MFNVQTQSSCQDHHLQVTPFADEIPDGISVSNPNDILFNNGAFIQLSRGIVCGRPDDFDSPLVCLMIGLSPGKGRKKRVMNIDDGAAHLI